MENLTRKTKVTLSCCLIIVLILSLLTISINIKSIDIFAEVEKSSVFLEDICKDFTENDYFIINGEEHHISEYEKYIDDTFDTDSVTVIDRDIKDEWLFSIVPIQLFEQEVKDFFYIGKRYGFYVNYINTEKRFLVYIMLHECKINEPSGHIVRKITPVYYEKYVFDKEDKTVALKYGVDALRTYDKYSKRHRIFLKNIGFSGALYNLNDFNSQEPSYDALNDNGGYFIGGSYKFNGVSTQTDEWKYLAEIFVIGLGVANPIIGTALGVLDGLEAIFRYQIDEYYDFREEITNENDYSFNINEIERDSQYEKYRHLLKDYVSVLHTPDNKEGVFFGINRGSYAQSSMYYKFANEYDKSNTAYVGKVKIDVVEEIKNNLSTTISTISTDIESNEFRDYVYTENRLNVVEDTLCDIYTFAGNERKLSFIPPENGFYTFETFGNVANDFIDQSDGKINKPDGINQMLKVYLKKGELFEFDSKNISGEKGIYQIKATFTPQGIKIGEQMNYTLKAGESEFLIFNNSDRIGFNYALDKTGNFSVSLMAEDRFNLIESSSMKNKNVNAIAKCENDTYIFKISNDGDVEENVQFILYPADTIDIVNGQARQLDVGHKVLFKIGQPMASNFIKFLLQSKNPIRLSLLDGQFNDLAIGDDVTYFEKSLMIEEGKDYYLYIQNVNEFNEKVDLTMSYDLWNVVMGENRIADKKYKNVMYNFSLISDASVTFETTNSVELSLYDIDLNLLYPQEGKYKIEKNRNYILLTSGEENSFFINVDLDYSEELSGNIGYDGYRYIKFLPQKTDHYVVTGVETFEWFNDRLDTFSGKFDEGATYYLKIYGESNASYDIDVTRKTVEIELRSYLNLRAGYYSINIEESGAYVFTSAVSNGVTAQYSIEDGEHNFICQSRNGGEKYNVHLDSGRYYIDIETEEDMGLLINMLNADNTQLNNTLNAGINHNEVFEVNSDNRYVFNANETSEYYLKIMYAGDRLIVNIAVTDSDLNEINLEDLQLEQGEQGKRYGVRMNLEKGKDYYINIYYSSSNLQKMPAEVLLHIPVKIQDAYLKSSSGEQNIQILRDRKEVQYLPVISMGRYYTLETPGADNITWKLSESTSATATISGNRICADPEPNYDQDIIRIKLKDDLGELEIDLILELPYSITTTCDSYASVFRAELQDLSQLHYNTDAFIKKMTIAIGNNQIEISENEISYYDLYKKGLDIFANGVTLRIIVCIEFYESKKSYELTNNSIPLRFLSLDSLNTSALRNEIFIDTRNTNVQNKLFEISASVNLMMLIGSQSQTLSGISFKFAAQDQISLYLSNYKVSSNKAVALDFSEIGSANLYLHGENRIDGKGDLDGKFTGYLIRAKSIKFCLDGSLDVIGADGDNGAQGASAGSSGYAGSDGGSGSRGEDGEGGTSALFCQSISKDGSGSIKLRGGNGGNGGNGRNGGAGGRVASNNYNNRVSGGDGGNGGRGGDGGRQGVGCSIQVSLDIVVENGDGGCGGSGGNGGRGGDGAHAYASGSGSNLVIQLSSAGGNGGYGGFAGYCARYCTNCLQPRGGHGGDGGYGGSGDSIQDGKNYVYDIAMYGGNGGNGGSGYFGGNGGRGGSGGDGADGKNATFTSSGGDGHSGKDGGKGGNGGSSWNKAGTPGQAGQGGVGGWGGAGGANKGAFKGGVKGADGIDGVGGTAGTYVETTYGDPVEIEGCIADGTLITLADGRQVAVETLKGDEYLLVWNMFTGKFDVAPILFIDKEDAKEYQVINLYFSDGTCVKVISEHGFWDFDLNEYVFLRDDAAKYIGHSFNKQSFDADGNMVYQKVKLVNVEVTTEFTSAWSPVTYSHLCYYVNGMLSMPGATTGLINIFDVDPETMRIDETGYLRDIESYGLFTYEEFAGMYPIPQEIFDAFGGKYLKVALGKGLITSQELEMLIERYSEFWEIA